MFRPSATASRDKIPALSKLACPENKGIYKKEGEVIYQFTSGVYVVFRLLMSLLCRRDSTSESMGSPMGADDAPLLCPDQALARGACAKAWRLSMAEWPL